MSIRYGVELVFDPSFTFQAYRVRQSVCSQYASWAAEMHMLRMPLVSYFECPEHSLPVLDAALADAAGKVAGSGRYFRYSGVSCDEDAGSVTLDLADAGVTLEEMVNVPGILNRSGSPNDNPDSQTLSGLHRLSAGAAAVTPGARAPEHVFRPAIPLVEYSGLPAGILQDAAEFARVVLGANGEFPGAARPWRMMVLRYSSEAAGEDWNNGRWASDLGWQPIYSYNLQG